MSTLIGITGGIGSGKSTIARGLQELGYAIYDTDREAKRIMQSNPAVRSQIEYLFGSEVYQDDVYQPQLVAPQVFADRKLLDKLNQVVHPAVAFDLSHWAKRQDTTCFVESAILFESGLDKLCEKVVCVTAPIDVRIARTVARDRSNPDKVRARISAQMPDEQRQTLSHIIVLNDGHTPVSQLCQQILQQI